MLKKKHCTNLHWNRSKSPPGSTFSAALVVLTLILKCSPLENQIFARVTRCCFIFRHSVPKLVLERQLPRSGNISSLIADRATVRCRLVWAAECFKILLASLSGFPLRCRSWNERNNRLAVCSVGAWAFSSSLFFPGFLPRPRPRRVPRAEILMSPEQKNLN